MPDQTSLAWLLAHKPWVVPIYGRNLLTRDVGIINKKIH